MAVTQQQAIDSELLARSDAASDRARIWRRPDYGDLECLHARFHRHTYAPHVHETFTFGAIVRGAELFRAYGANHIATPGKLTVLNPDVLHDGAPSDRGYEYRMIYPSADLMREILAELRGAAAGEAWAGDPLPYFREPLYDDPELASRYEALHRVFDRDADRLQRDSGLVQILSTFVARYSDTPVAIREVGRETGLVARIRARLGDGLGENLGLADLARDEGVSRFHLLRAFKKELGMTPNAYRTSLRVNRARGLLARGEGLAATAAACGFFDQSHFSKSFKSVVGVTPGQYRAAFAA